MKFVAGGISKRTGKPFSSFWSCRDCGETFTPQQPDAKSVKFQAELEEDLIAQRVREKRENIAWLNAKNNACHLIAHHPLFSGIKDPALFKELIIKWANWIYKLTPEKAEIDDSSDIEEISKSI
jgi:hypothetical protein